MRTYLSGDGHRSIHDGAQESIICKWIPEVIRMHWELPTHGSNYLANSSSSEFPEYVPVASLIRLSLLLGPGAVARIQQRTIVKSHRAVL